MMSSQTLKAIIAANLARVGVVTPELEAFALRITADIIEAATQPSAPAAAVAPAAPRFGVAKGYTQPKKFRFTCKFCQQEHPSCKKKQFYCTVDQNSNCYNSRLTAEKGASDLRRIFRLDSSDIHASQVLRAVKSREWCRCLTKHGSSCIAGSTLQRYLLACKADNITLSKTYDQPGAVEVDSGVPAAE